MSTGNDPLKNMLLGVASTLSVSAVLAVSSMYTDVQLLKQESQQQSDISKIVQNLDKQVALNNQAVEALNRVVTKLSEKIDSENYKK